MSKRILMIGAMDTKGAEYAFLRERLEDCGADVITLDVGVFDPDSAMEVDVPAADVAQAGGSELPSLRASGDRGQAMQVMADGAAALTRQLYKEDRFDGVIGMGGSGGTSVISAAMRGLPLGVPKVCISTVAASDTAPYVGAKDITLIPSITDVAGVNRVSRIIMSRAAGAVCGMVGAQPATATADDRPIIVASMFGNTTECVDACRAQLDDAGYEVLVFHATGTGGRTMESLIDEGMVDACLDITTTEWADETCGGIFGAGEDRLSAPGRNGVPHLIVPGCIDMVNFGPLASVPAKYRDAGRLLYEWNPSITLMRTNAEENQRMGEIFAKKANAAQGPVAVLLPLRGFSILDGEGERFCDRQADAAFASALRAGLNSNIRIEEVDANINDPQFAERAVAILLEMLGA